MDWISEFYKTLRTTEKMGVTLDNTTVLQDAPATEAWDGIRKMYRMRDFKSKFIAIIFNACLTENKITFLLSRRLLEKLISNSNGVNRNTVNGKEFREFKAWAIKHRLLEERRISTRKKAGVFKVEWEPMVNFILKQMTTEIVKKQDEYVESFYDNNVEIIQENETDFDGSDNSTHSNYPLKLPTNSTRPYPYPNPPPHVLEQERGRSIEKKEEDFINQSSSLFNQEQSDGVVPETIHPNQEPPELTDEEIVNIGRELAVKHEPTPPVFDVKAFVDKLPENYIHNVIFQRHVIEYTPEVIKEFDENGIKERVVDTICGQFFTSSIWPERKDIDVNSYKSLISGGLYDEAKVKLVELIKKSFIKFKNELNTPDGKINIKFKTSYSKLFNALHLNLPFEPVEAVIDGHFKSKSHCDSMVVYCKNEYENLYNNMIENYKTLTLKKHDPLKLRVQRQQMLTADFIAQVENL